MTIVKSLIRNNYTNTRNGKRIDRIVIHTYGGGGTNLQGWFNNPNAKVSAHYSVEKSGLIRQYVPEWATAWHAGNWNINQRSFGIEHQDDGNYMDSKRTDALYKSSSELVAFLCKKHSIPCNRKHIIKHNQIVNRACPGGLDVDRIIKQANKILNPPIKNDNLYRVFKDKKQLNAFKNKENAFNFWLEDKSRTVEKNNKNITYKFKEMAEKYEKEIKTLKEAKEKYEKRINELEQETISAVEHIEKMNEEIEILRAQRNEVLGIREESKNEAVNLVNDLAKESFKSSGIMGWWESKVNSFVDSKLNGNKKIKSILKYGIFVQLGAFIGTGGILSIARYYNLDIESQTYGILAAISGTIFQVLLANYDKNDDGKLDKEDYI